MLLLRSCWMEESFFIWFLTVPVLISFICSISKLINGWRKHKSLFWSHINFLLSKTSSPSSSSLPREYRESIDNEITSEIAGSTAFGYQESSSCRPHPNSTLWIAKYFDSISSTKGIDFRGNLPYFIGCNNKLARIMRVLSLLFCQPWGHHCGAQLFKQPPTVTLQNVLSWELLCCTGTHHNTRTSLIEEN